MKALAQRGPQNDSAKNEYSMRLLSLRSYWCRMTNFPKKNSIFLAYEIHKFSKHYNSKKASKGRRKHAHRCVQCPKAQSVIIIK